MVVRQDHHHQLGQPHIRRTRLEPSRSMPMAARRNQNSSPASTPRQTRSVVHVPRRPQRTYSGKGNPPTPNPYRETVSTIRSPSRSGKASIQSMAMVVNASTAEKRNRKDSSDMTTSSLHPHPIPPKTTLYKMAVVKSHATLVPVDTNDVVPCEECFLGNGSDDNDKRRRLTSYGIAKSIVKAATLIAFGFGSGYVYSHHMGGGHNHHHHATHRAPPTTTMAPWGYSPADPLVQKLLQHNKHEDVIQDIKQMKFPGRTPQEEPKLELMPPPPKKEGEDSNNNNNNLDGIPNAENNNNQVAADEKDVNANKEVNPNEHPDAAAQEIPKDNNSIRHGQIRLRGGESQPQTPQEAHDITAPPQKHFDSWDHQEEKLVHLVNRSARKIRLFWIPSSTATTNQWVPMSDPFIDDGQDFYLHARPTHNFAVREEPYEGDKALEFTVVDTEKQKVLVYDNWQIEVKADNDPSADQEPPVVHENPKEQHAPPEYMNQQQNSEQYWEQQRQQQQQQQEENKQRDPRDRFQPVDQQQSL